MIKQSMMRGVLSMAVMVAAGAWCSAAEPQQLVWPKRLSPGDTVMLIAPAGPPKRDEVMRFKERIEERGYHVKMRDDLFDVEGYLAGSDQRRADELMEAFADPEVDGVLCRPRRLRLHADARLARLRQDPSEPQAVPRLQRHHGAARGDERRRASSASTARARRRGWAGEKGPTDFTAKYVVRAIGSDARVAGGAVRGRRAGGRVRRSTSFGKGKAQRAARRRQPVADLGARRHALRDRYEGRDSHDRRRRTKRLTASTACCSNSSSRASSTRSKAPCWGSSPTDFVREDKLTDDERFDVDGVLRQYFEDARRAGAGELPDRPLPAELHACRLGGEVEIDADAKTLRSWLLKVLATKTGSTKEAKMKTQLCHLRFLFVSLCLESLRLTKQFVHHFAAVDDLDRPAAAAHVFVVGVDAQACGRSCGTGRASVTGRSVTSVPASSVGADHLPAADAAAGQGHVERLREVVAAAAGVDLRRAAELAHPDHQRPVEHAALLAGRR